MLTLYTCKKWCLVALLTVLLMPVHILYGQGSEDFSAMTYSGTSYKTGSFIGNNSVTWNYTSCRGDQKIDGKAICSGKSNTVSLKAENIPNGIGTLSFKYKQAFSKSSKLTISIKGSDIETIDVNDKSVKTYSKDISVSGDFSIEFKTTERVVIDDIEWSAYSSGPTQSTAKSITSFTINGKTATINEVDHTINLLLPASTDLTSLSPTIEISSKASIDPASGVSQNFTNPVTYRVTAEDASTQTYEVTVTKEAVIASNILINELDCDQAANDEGKEDTGEFVELYDGGVGNSSLDGHVLVFFNGSTDQSYYSIDLSGENTNAEGFFVVGNEDVANVGLTFPSNKLQNGADAVALYKAPAASFPSNTAFTTNNLVDLLVYDTSDSDDADLLAGLLGGGQINENGKGDKNNHSTFRATDGEGGARNTTAYVAGTPTPGKSNTSAPVQSSAKAITSFSINGKTATVNEADHTIGLTLPASTDLTSLAPAIEISSKASIDPASGVSQNFTNPVTYTVTAEDASTQNYVVSITKDAGVANDGSEEKPFTIAEAIALPNTESTSKTPYYAYGYIVSVGEDFDAPFTNGNYVSVADSKDETNHDNCLNLKLATSEKAAWNLMDHPENLGKQIKFDGYRGLYYSHPSFEGNKVVEELSSGPSLPTVELSLSTTSASEADATAITLTATTSEIVGENQTVVLSIAGTGITAGDYTLSTTQVTILAGESSATSTLTIADDSEKEGSETLTVSLSNPSAGIALGTTVTGSISIADNDGGSVGGSILDNYVYLDASTSGDGSIVVNLTPKEYVATVSPSHHMTSVKIPENYYGDAVGLTGDALRAEIHNIIEADSKKLGYSAVWDMCEDGDQNPKNASQVWQMYVEEGIAKSAHVSGSTGWNREHTWAKSHGDFGTSAGAGTDGHHLRATDARENSTRGSRDFGNDSPGYTPPKSARGDVARMIFYMATRWEMTVDDQCKQTESAARHGKLSHLLQWHEEDPVDPYEVRRNNVIYGYQNNRNPFIDHPELVQYIFGEAKAQAWDGGQGTSPSKLKVSGAIAGFGMVKFGEESSIQTFTVSANELTENIVLTAPQHFVISKDGSSFSSSLTLAIIEGNLAETTISVKFVPESALAGEVKANISIVSGEESKSIAVSGIEGDPALVPVAFLNEDFESNTHSNWILKSEVGGKAWEIADHSNNKYMQMSAYQASGDVVSWLITPALDLDKYNNEKLNFKTKNGYYKGTTLEVLISTDFDGADVASATWQTLAATIDERNNSQYGSTYVLSGDVDLSTYEGIAYIAFKYSGNGSSLTTTYQVDNVVVEGNKIPLNGSLISNASGDITFAYTEKDDYSAAQTYELSFDKLEGDISISASDNYEVSMDGVSWKSSLSIAKTETSPKTIHVRFAPKQSALNGLTGSITHKAKGAEGLIIKTVSNKSSEIADASTLGKDKTLDIVSWNVEWFGAPGKSKSASGFSQQLDAVSAKIISFDADVYALQELVSDELNGDYLQPLVDKLNELAGSDVYAGIIGERYSHDDSAPSTEFPAQRVCYIYNKNTVSKLNDFSMFSDLYQGGSTSSIDGYTGDASKFWASGRLPYFFEADVTINGATERIAFVNIHAKCCSNSHSRKLADAKFLINALNTDYSDDNLVVLGDYNDYLEGSMTSGNASPYASWFTTDEHFDHVLTSTSNIDHITISNELYDEYQILTNNTSQENVSISDHDPIMLRLKLRAYTSQLLVENADALIFDHVDVDNSEAPSAAKTYTVKGVDLAEDITVSVDQSFELSLDGSAWSSSIVIPKEQAASKEVQIRFNPALAYTEKVTANIIHKTKGAKTVTIPVVAYGKPDLVAPEFISGYPAIVNYTSSSFNMKVQLSEAGKVYFVVLADNSEKPLVDEVKNGTGAIVAESFEIGTDEVIHEVTGLSPNTNYDIYLVAEDDNEPIANKTEEVSELEVKTNDHILLPYEYVVTVSEGEHYESTGIPVNYYHDAEGKKANELKSKLAEIINIGFVSYPYEEDGRGDEPSESRRFVTGDVPLDVYDILDEADRDPNNPSKVYMVYKEVVYEVDAKHLGLNGSQEKWNREHVYPQSTGGFKNARAPWGSGSYANGNIIENAGDDLALAQSDAHHLRSSDKNENSKRNNYPFANSTSGSKYSPPLSAKGDVARIIFYLNVRYGLDISKVGSLEMFKEWNEIDPVDPYEVRRNNIVYKYQKNRNPFVDYPELVEYIYGDKTSTVWKAAEKKTQSITFAELADKTYGDAAFELTASASSSLAVSFELVSGPATLSGNELSITGAGAVSVKAIQLGDDNYKAAEEVVRTFTVNKAAQVITFAELSDKTYGDAAFALTASASSSLAVSFEVVSGPATLSGNELSITGAGAVSVKAVQLGDDNYKAAEEVVRTFTVNKAAQVITFAELSDKSYGDAAFALTASASSSLAVSFEVVSGPATLSGNELSITGAGAVSVKAVQLGDDNYKAAEEVVRTFTVNKAVQVITFAELSDKSYGDAAFALTANASSELAVAFEVVSGPATLSGNELSITGAGAVSVKAVQLGDDNYKAAEEVVRTFTVNKVAQAITFAELADKTYGDAAFALTASASSELAVSFELVSGPATLSGNELCITGAGAVSVKAVQLGDDNYKEAEEVVRTFTVNKAAQVITFAELADKTYGDAAFELTASASSSLAVSFELVSGPATLSGNELSITGAGAVSVKAVQLGDDNYKAAEEVVRTFTVNKAAQVITFAELADKTYGDAAFALTANASSELAVALEVVSGNATLSGNELSITGAGAVSVKAVQLGDDNYKAADELVRTFTVNKAAQAITFAELSDKTYGDAAFALTASASSELAVALEVVSGPATISGNELSITGAGAVSVKAIQAGDANYKAAEEVVRTFTVNKAAQVITFAELADKTYGDAAFALTASASSELAVSFELVSGPATISGNELSITGAGQVSVKAIQLGDDNYKAADDVVRTFTVSKVAQAITFTELADKTYGDAAFALAASASSELAVSFELVSGPATLSGNELSITGAGAVSVKAVQLGDANYKAAEEVVRTFTVNKAVQAITFAELSDKSYGDAAFALTASSSSELAVSFELVSGPATLSGNELCITGAGTVSVKAVQLGDDNYKAAEEVVRTFTVNKAAQVITFAELSDKTYGDAAFALTASASSELAVSFELVSGPATISGNELSITGAGAVSVKAIQAGDANYKAAEEVVRTFTVNKAAQAITFAELADKTYGDAAFALTASASSELAVSFELVSGPATLSGNELCITGAGAVSVKAIQLGDDNYKAADDVVRTFTVNKAAQAITFTELADKTYGDAAFTLEASASSELAVSFELVSGPATISGNELCITGAGTVSVKAVQLGDDNYKAADDLVRTFTVNKAAQVITFAELSDKTYGDAAFALTASASSELAVAFEVVSGPATISGNELSITGAGQVSVKAVQLGDDNYKAAEEVVRTFTVNKVAQAITFAELADKTYGDAAFALTASASSSLAVSFEVVSGPATLSGNELSITGAGQVSVKAIQAGDANYKAAEEVVRTFTVNKAAQAITFAELADKTYGDAAFALTASASSSLAVSFEVVSGPASIKGNELTITGAGEVSIKAMQLGDEYYAAAESVTRALDVFKADQQISFESIEDYILGGDPIELIAESNSGLEVEFEIVEGEGEVDGNLLSPASVGNFVVRAYQSGDENYNSAESTQEFMVDQATGIEDVFAEQMKMYPNPATDFVNLKFPDNKLKQIVLLNAAGQVIKTVTAYKELRLNVQNLRTGVYFVSVKSEGFVVTKRLMVVNR